MSATPKIAVRDLHKSFGEKHVLRGVDLEVGHGESVVVIGGSGNGKSVTLKCILGLLHPESGSITIEDCFWMVRSTPSSTTLEPKRFLTPMS